MSIPATGRIVPGATGHDLVIERTFKAPIVDFWKSIVEPERMNRWLGTWSGETGPGKRVMFRMTAEGKEAPEEEVLIHACDAPRLLDVENFQPGTAWRMQVELSESNGATTLIFRQRVTPKLDASSVGPGWEYYLDRLLAIHEGTEFAAWDDYYPAQQEHWNEQLKAAFPE